jgi:endo-1,4-beta-D-glucanase Y
MKESQDFDKKLDINKKQDINKIQDINTKQDNKMNQENKLKQDNNENRFIEMNVELNVKRHDSLNGKSFKKKRNWLLGIIFLYIFIGAIFATLIAAGVLPKAPPLIATAVGNDSLPEVPKNSFLTHLQSAQDFMDKSMIEKNGHINLYIAAENFTSTSNTINSSSDINDFNTNSEAVSYYLLWTATAGDKEKFDKELQYVQTYMIYPNFGYMMWRLAQNDSVVGDGSNIASDADLRTIKALLIAEKQWHDVSYTNMISQIASGIQKVAITKDNYLAPYGGVSGETATWTANEVWLSYTDFTVLNELANRFGAPWTTVYANMKKASLNAQIANGLYNSMLTESRQYGNGIDAGGYSINSMWMMVRNAESSDTDLVQAANKSLQFYKNKFQIDGELYATYGSNGDALSAADTPWVYALVGRAAIALNDKDFSDKMIQKLIEKQVNDTSSKFYGSFPEDYKNDSRVGQFTMQESILTMQAYSNKVWPVQQ